MSLKQRRHERNLIARLERIERILVAICKVAGVDPDTLADLDKLQAIQDDQLDALQEGEAEEIEQEAVDQALELLQQAQATPAAPVPDPVVVPAETPAPTATPSPAPAPAVAKVAEKRPATSKK